MGQKGTHVILQQDVIVDIPPNRVRYFGTTGKMLLPSAAAIARCDRYHPGKQAHPHRPAAQEGFSIDTNGKTPKVKQFADSLIRVE